jgi:hypothetical protein
MECPVKRLLLIFIFIFFKAGTIIEHIHLCSKRLRAVELMEVLVMHPFLWQETILTKFVFNECEVEVLVNMT